MWKMAKYKICLYTCTQNVAFYVSSEGLWKREQLTLHNVIVLLRYLLSFM